MKRPGSSSLLALIFLFLPAPGFAQAQPNSLKSSPGLRIADLGSWKVIHKGSELRKLVLERADPHHVIELKMARFDGRWIAPRIVRSLHYNLPGTNVKTLAEKSGAVAMINANYFDEKGRPLGFLKTAADEVNPAISKSSLFTGIFAIKGRTPFILHRDNFSSQQADEGLQVGPLLLLKGSALAVTRGAGNKSRRSVVGLDKDYRMIIAVTDSFIGGLSWVELQEIFGSEQWQAQMTDLLNLDGGGSTQLYVKGPQIEEHVAGAADIPVAIGFFQRIN